MNWLWAQGWAVFPKGFTSLPCGEEGTTLGAARGKVSHSLSCQEKLSSPGEVPTERREQLGAAHGRQGLGTSHQKPR